MSECLDVRMSECPGRDAEAIPIETTTPAPATELEQQKSKRPRQGPGCLPPMAPPAEGAQGPSGRGVC